MTDDRIGTWLRETRLRQVMPGTRKKWSQDYLLEQMGAVGWAPHRPNYSKYETGKSQPEPDTLDKFIAFWAARGEPGPDLGPKPLPEPPPDLATALVALTEELRAWRQEREELEARVEGLGELVARLAEQVGAASPGRPVPDGTKG